MKLQLFLLLLLRLILVSVACIANAATQEVYDTEDNKLVSSESALYFVLPAKPGSGGGFNILLTNPYSDFQCLSFVFQESNETLLRIPVGISPMPPNALGEVRSMPLNASDEVICLSSDIWFLFWDFDNLCSRKHDWHLTDQSPQSLPGQYQHVAAGNNGGLWSKGVFRIERHGADTTGYKLVACVNGEGCKDLGLHTYNNRTWLTVSDDPLMVVFKKAKV